MEDLEAKAQRERESRERADAEAAQAAADAALARRLAEAEAEREREQARLRADAEAETQRLAQEETLRRQELAEAARQEEEDARVRLEQWLRRERFEGVNERRKTLMKAKFPLHSAVKRRDLDVVQLLLRFQADPMSRNSSGLTAQQLAQKNNKDGSQDAILQALVGPVRRSVIGGA